jgi:hypothetical protein
MHQPYYNTTDPNYWDGEKDGIFGSRAGNYTLFHPGGGAPVHRRRPAPRRPVDHLERLADRTVQPLRRARAWCGGAFGNWNANRCAESRRRKPRSAIPRVDFTAFGFYHPLMPLIPASQHRPADRVAPRRHPRCVRRGSLDA